MGVPLATDTEAKVRWVPAYIGIGSNLDDPAGHVRRALRDLASLAGCRFVCASTLYRNPPMDGVVEPAYVNAVAGLLTRLQPLELLAGLRGIEAAHGRVRDAARKWVARPLDLDLLVFGSHRVRSPELNLPHPGIPERNFVLFPLLEIAPGLDIPGMGAVTHLAGRLTRDGLEALPA